MRHSTRVLAVAVSAALGVVAGVVAGVVLRPSASVADPLGLGIPLVNQSCTGKSLLMLSWGDRAPALSTGMGEAPDGRARYLQTARSCPTFYTTPQPRYVTYLGPFDTREQACRERMTVSYIGDVVTRLAQGNDEQVECLCYLPISQMPDLRIGAELAPGDAIWVRALQRVLRDLGLMPAGELTRVYDPATEHAVQEFQAANGLQPNGVMKRSTWTVVVTKGCRLYNS